MNLLHELNAGQYPSRIVELLEAEHRLYPEFYAPMVPIPQIIPTFTGLFSHYQKELEAILKALDQ